MITIIRKSETKQVAEHSVSTFTEYPLPFESLSVGISEINGRYPETGFDVDMSIEQVWYVESGEGSIEMESENLNVSAGDMVHIPKGNAYAIIGKNLKLLVSSSPPWTSDQHTHLDT